MERRCAIQIPWRRPPSPASKLSTGSSRTRDRRTSSRRLNASERAAMTSRWRTAPVALLVAAILAIFAVRLDAQELVAVDGQVAVRFSGLVLNRKTNTFDT